MAALIHKDTERDYSQREYGKNTLMVGDRGNSSGDVFQGDDVREHRVDLREGRKEQLATDDGGVDSRGYRARLRSERIWEERSRGWRRR
jgi:hypothetical protein